MPHSESRIVEDINADLVPIEKYAILNESAENMRAIVADNLGNGTLSPFDLEQIRVPAGGSTLCLRGSNFGTAGANSSEAGGRPLVTVGGLAAPLVGNYAASAGHDFGVSTFSCLKMILPASSVISAMRRSHSI